MPYVSVKNQTNFIGRLCQDPELKVTINGKDIVNFNLAVDKGYGENKRAIFPRMVAFDTQAKYIAKLAKGTEISVVCEYEIREYTTREGEKKQSHEFTVCDVVAHGKKETADASAGAQIPLAYAGDRAGPQFEAVDADGDLPF